MNPNVQFGTEGIALRKKVKFVNTNSSAAVVLYEGMPFCYQFDTTTNILGYDKGNGSGSSTPNTTAEGYHNEGKFLIVDLPDSDNIHAFAGVLCSGSWCGKTIADDGEIWLEIYVPNGAIVPVRTDQNCTCGTTVLAIHTGEQHLTGPYETAGRPVALAWETLDNSSAAALVLAKLDPNLFIYQKADATNLNVDDQDTGNTLFLNQIKVDFTSATGNCCALSVQSTCSAGAGSSGYGASVYIQGDLTGVASEHWNPFGCWANITAGTQTGVHLTVAEFGIYAAGANLAGVESLSCITLRNQVSSTNPPNAVHNVIRVVKDGTGDSPDFLFAFYTPESTGLAAKSSAAVSHVIPIKVENAGTSVSAGTYYIMVSDTL